MGEIDGEFGRVRDALERPTIRLLSRPSSPVLVAIFRVTFGRDVQYVPADRFHLQVEEYLADLAARGAKIPSNGAERGSGRALCREWVHDQWLVRTSTDDGEEQYSLTSYALEALSLIDGLSQDRALISESRLAMILDSVRRWALKASPDRDEHVRRIDAQILELTAERDRLAAGGVVEAATNENMQDGYANVSDLIRQLPSDFKRVEESVVTMHRAIVEDFRNDTRPIGEILDEYLSRTDELMTSTAEGRAFEGAFELLRDENLLLGLKNDLQAILEHPFAGGLPSGEQRSFRGTVGIIRQGIDDVLAQRRRLTATLRDHIVNHDVIHDGHLDAVLRSLNQQLAVWMRTAGPRASVPVRLLPESVDVDHLRERFHDPDIDIVPPGIADDDDDAPEPLTLEELRTQGGPLLIEMRAALSAAIDGGAVDGDAADTHDVFNALPDELRRPVELFGLLHIVTQLDADERSTGREAYTAVRPDGSRATFELPTIPLLADDLRALLEATETD